MIRIVITAVSLAVLTPAPVHIQKNQDPDGQLPVALIVNPYSGSRLGSDYSEGPESLRLGGIEDRLAQKGCRIARSERIELDPEEKRAYGDRKHATRSKPAFFNNVRWIVIIDADL